LRETWFWVSFEEVRWSLLREKSSKVERSATCLKARGLGGDGVSKLFGRHEVRLNGSLLDLHMLYSHVYTPTAGV
jgi:hypothetical protein